MTPDDPRATAALAVMQRALDRIAAAVEDHPDCPSPLHPTRQATVRPRGGGLAITAVRGWRDADDPAGDIVEVILSCEAAPDGHLEGSVCTDAGAEVVDARRHLLPALGDAGWPPSIEAAVDAEAGRLLAAVPQIVDELVYVTGG